MCIRDSSNDYKEKLGDEAFAQACTDARAVADALRAAGYTIASHSYGHLTCGDSSPERLASDCLLYTSHRRAAPGDEGRRQDRRPRRQAYHQRADGGRAGLRPR